MCMCMGMDMYLLMYTVYSIVTYICIYIYVIVGDYHILHRCSPGRHYRILNKTKEQLLRSFKFI